MGLGAELRASTLVAVVELRRSWRSLRPTGRWATIKLLFGVGLVVLYGIALGVAGSLAVRAIETRPLRAVRPIARATALGIVFSMAVFVVPRTVRKNGYPDAAPGLLTATSHRRIAVGLLLAEIGRITAVAAVPIAGLAAGVGVGAGSVAAGSMTLFVAGLLVVAGASVGSVGGLLIKRIATTSPFARRHRTALTLTASMAVPIGYAVLLAQQTVIAELVDILQGVPLGWGTDLILAVVLGNGVPVWRGVVGVATLVGTAILAVPVLEQLAAVVWFADRPPSTGPASVEGGPTPGTDRRVASRPLAVLPRESRAVALKHVRRAIRAPFTVQYATIGLFALLAEAQTIIVTGQVPARLPVFVALAGAWGGGALFALNPLGNEGTVLPVTLTTGVDGEAVIRGITAASLLIAVPPTVIGVVLTAVAAPLTRGYALTILVVTPILLGGATGLAATMGLRYPKLSATAVGRDRTVVVPSPYAVGAFSLALLLAASPAVLTAVEATGRPVARLLGQSLPTIRMVGLLATTALLGTGGLLAGRRAATQFEEWRLA
ncbi:MAG: hypothetical protein ABEJ35_02850 [Halobacteriaceae archaeon]